MKRKALGLLVFVALLLAMNMCGLEVAMAVLSQPVGHACCPQPASPAAEKQCCDNLVGHEPALPRIHKISAYELTDFSKNLLILTPNTFTGSIHAGEISRAPEPQTAPSSGGDLSFAGSIHSPPSMS